MILSNVLESGMEKADVRMRVAGGAVSQGKGTLAELCEGPEWYSRSAVGQKWSSLVALSGLPGLDLQWNDWLELTEAHRQNYVGTQELEKQANDKSELWCICRAVGWGQGYKRLS